MYLKTSTIGYKNRIKDRKKQCTHIYNLEYDYNLTNKEGPEYIAKLIYNHRKRREWFKERVFKELSKVESCQRYVDNTVYL